MKLFSKVMLALCLALVAGCPGGGTSDGADTGGAFAGKDAGPILTCKPEKRCNGGTTCCTDDQDCYDDECVTCGCGIRKCGVDDCGLPCGTCSQPQTCVSGQCIVQDKCNPNPCSGERPFCNAAGACECTTTSCTGGKACDTATKTCIDPNKCPAGKCTGETPTCNPVTGACECTTAPDSCTGGKSCNAATKVCEACPTALCGGLCCQAGEGCQNGSCKTCGCGTAVCGSDACGTKCGPNGGDCPTPATQLCTEAGACVDKANACATVNCTVTGETCDPSDAKCHCNPANDLCGVGSKCDATSRKCQKVDLCAGKNCPSETPYCNPASGGCECTTGSCTGGKVCDAASKTCKTPDLCAGKTCPSETPYCNPANGGCECTTGSCTGGKSCDAVSKTCKAPDLCAGKSCTGETPYCNSTTGGCECTASSCPDDKRCDSQTRTCIDPCTGKTCPSETPVCNSVAGGRCDCTASSCTGGKSCNLSTGQCQTSSCTGCASGESCVAGVCQCTLSPDSCSAATAGAFKCDATSKRCVAAIVTCNGVTCGQGQICADPAGGTATQCTCMYARWKDPQNHAAGVDPDTCEGLGMVCNYEESESGPWTCAMPGLFDPCKPSVGCDPAYPGLSCELMSTVSGGTGTFCVTKCVSGASCASAAQRCATDATTGVKFCTTNVCADPEADPTTRTNLFKPCNAEGTGDGQCLPYPSYDSNRNPIELGICWQTGSSTGICNPFGSRADKSKLCTQGNTCEFISEVLPATTPKTYQGICRPVCNSADAPDASASKSCTSGFCSDQSWVQRDQGVGTGDYVALTGACLPPCSVFPAPAGTACATDLLGYPRACTPVTFSGNGYCTLEEKGGLLPAGAACTTARESAWGDVCAGNAYCNSTTGTCLGWCDATVCTNSSVACTSCLPSTAKCVPIQSGPIGRCTP